MQSNQTFFLRSIQNLETEQIISQPTKLNKNLMNKMLNIKNQHRITIILNSE